MGLFRVVLGSFGAFSTGIILTYHLHTSSSCKKGLMADVCPELQIAKPIRFFNQVSLKLSPTSLIPTKEQSFISKKELKTLSTTLKTTVTNNLKKNEGGERVEEVIGEGEELLVESWQDMGYTGWGKVMFMSDVKGRVARVRDIIKYLEEHPEVKERPPIDDDNGLLVITGLHRTGSTFLQNLLAQDPNARTPYSWEMLTSLEEQKIGKKELIEKKSKELDSIDKLLPNWVETMRQLHDFRFEKPEEDCLALQNVIPNPSKIIAIYPTDNLVNWWKKELPTLGWYQSRYLHLYFKLLDHKREQEEGSIGRKHWLTKNPDHSNYLTELLEEFPKANIVITHRHPDKVLPSWAKLNAIIHFPAMHNDTLCEEGNIIPLLRSNSLFGERCLHHMAVASDNLVGHRMKLSKLYPELEKRIYDVDWKTFMADPVQEVKQIYSHFDYEFSEEFENNLRNYLIENRRYKKGRLRYSMEEFRLSTLQVREAMKWYIETFEEKF